METHSESLPEGIIPKALASHAERWERKRKSIHAEAHVKVSLKKMLYARSYAQLLPLFENANLSWREIAEKIGFSEKINDEWLKTIFVDLTRQFFPTAVGTMGRKRKERKNNRSVQLEALKEDFCSGDTTFQLLVEFCKKAELTVEPIQYTSKEGFFAEKFLIGGLMCFVGVHDRASNGTQKLRVLNVSRPPPDEYAIVIRIIVMGAKDRHRHTAYVFPNNDEQWPTKSPSGALQIPLIIKPPRLKKQIDYTPYRDENGLALLAEAVKKHRTT